MPAACVLAATLGWCAIALGCLHMVWLLSLGACAVAFGCRSVFFLAAPVVQLSALIVCHLLPPPKASSPPAHPLHPCRMCRGQGGAAAEAVRCRFPRCGRLLPGPGQGHQGPLRPRLLLHPALAGAAAEAAVLPLSRSRGSFWDVWCGAFLRGWVVREILTGVDGNTCWFLGGLRACSASGHSFSSLLATC